MGRLIYGARGLRIDMEDRLLAHVQAVVVAKLRRNEPFYLSWTQSPGEGSGRRSIWVNATLELAMEFAGSRPIELDRQQLDTLMSQANSNTGLDLGENAQSERAASQRVTPVA